MAHAVLITGAAGYIGSLVTRALAGDARPLKSLVAADVREVPAARRVPGVTYVVLDTRSPELAGVLAEHGVDTVVHLASIVTPAPGSSADEQYSVDVVGTRNVLEACVKAGVTKLVVTSSGAAYGYHADNGALLTEDAPLRGNDEFAYARHKRLVEELLARHRAEHPSLRQLVFRPGTVLGPATRNQITALFEKRVVVGLRGAATPFVFIWDEDVVACIVQGVHGESTGVYNLAGDGVMTLREIAARLGRRYVAVSPRLMRAALAGLRRAGLTQYGPEQVAFLQYRPVLSNDRLKQTFGYRPRRTTREAFEAYATSRA